MGDLFQLDDGTILLGEEASRRIPDQNVSRRRDPLAVEDCGSSRARLSRLSGQSSAMSTHMAVLVDGERMRELDARCDDGRRHQPSVL
jgi:hypothetical protein